MEGFRTGAQSPLEVGNGHRFCVAKSETAGLWNNRAAAVLPGNPGTRSEGPGNQTNL